MNASSQTLSRVRPLCQSPQASRFVDREGDVWEAAGRNSGGELLLACPQPSNPEDAGVGDSFAWTLRLVETAFGPLKPVSL
ncbi:hypothetical protein [Streptomyces antibioticus]|uniref:hypothetical protein n=1 Tax=Streptomyces antibioticus TaxID=1890 RepID=UPI0033E015FD